jgi:hypothetical protein
MKKLAIASFIMLSSCSWLDSIGKWGDENMPVYNKKPEQHVEGNRQAPSMQGGAAPSSYPYGMPPTSNMPPLNPAEYPAPAMSGDMMQQQYQNQEPVPYMPPSAPVGNGGAPQYAPQATSGQYSFGGPSPMMPPMPAPTGAGAPPQIPEPPQGYGQQPPAYQQPYAPAQQPQAAATQGYAPVPQQGGYGQPASPNGYSMQSTGQKYDDFPPEYQHVKH